MENKAKKKYGIWMVLLIVGLVCLTACGKGKKETSIVGTWSSANGEEVLIFDKDGTCSVPFTYNASWLEACDRYVIDSEGKLVLSSSKGNIDSERYAKRDSAEAVEENGGYYLSDNTLTILDFRTLRTYTKQ